MQDSAALANTDYVQLEKLFQQLLKAKEAEAVADNCLATNSCSGISCSAAVRDVTLTKRPSDPAVVAAATVEKAAGAAAEAKREDKSKASSASETVSQRAGGLPAGNGLRWTRCARLAIARGSNSQARMPHELTAQLLPIRIDDKTRWRQGCALQARPTRSSAAHSAQQAANQHQPRAI